MSFHTTIARLREASYSAPAAGEDPNTCRVRRQDLRESLHLIDRLDADLRGSSLISQGPPAAVTLPPEVRTAAARLTKLAQETRAIYGQDTCAGGEPSYPAWTDDILTLANFADGRPLDAPTTPTEACNHEYGAEPKNARHGGPWRAVCMKCGHAPSAVQEQGERNA